MFYEKWKLKPKSEKRWGALAVLTLILISSITIISLYTPPYNNSYFEPIFFSSGQSVSSHSKDAIYLYPNRNDSNVDNSPSVGSHSYWPNLADQNISTFDTLTECNTNHSNFLTLVPNGGTVSTELSPYPNTKQNWECCNTSDDDASYVFLSELLRWRRDLYNLENPPGIDGAIINSVEVYMRVKLSSSTESAYGSASPILWNPSWSVGEQSKDTFTVYAGDYINLSSRWVQNPDTLESWSWTDLADLQAGIKFRIQKGPAELRCTFVWVVVNYTVPNYELDLELQWTNVPLTASNNNLCIRTGSFTSNESLSVWYWNGNSWTKIIPNLQSNTWNNASLKIDGSVFTIQFKGNNESEDRVQDSWEIALAVLVVEYVPPVVPPYFEMFFVAFLLLGGNQPSVLPAAFIVGAVALVSVLGLVVGRFYVSGENASFRRGRLRQLEEARERIRRALEDGGGGAS
ncbi:MAG: hypothetical protein QW261_13435 [Candidatus Jordarchaeaceae archaeon]